MWTFNFKLTILMLNWTAIVLYYIVLMLEFRIVFCAPYYNVFYQWNYPLMLIMYCRFKTVSVDPLLYLYFRHQKVLNFYNWSLTFCYTVTLQQYVFVRFYFNKFPFCYITTQHNHCLVSCFINGARCLPDYWLTGFYLNENDGHIQGKANNYVYLMLLRIGSG